MKLSKQGVDFYFAHIDPLCAAIEKLPMRGARGIANDLYAAWSVVIGSLDTTNTVIDDIGILEAETCKHVADSIMIRLGNKPLTKEQIKEFFDATNTRN